MSKPGARGKLPPELSRRVWIADLRPRVDGGAHPIKRTPGERVAVTADILADGHDKIAAVLRWRPVSSRTWTEVRMEPGANDRWQAEFTVGAPERHEYTVRAWIDRFASWRDALQKKHGAGQAVESELREGAEIVREAAARAAEPDRAWLLATAARLADGAGRPESVERALSAELRAQMDRHAERPRATEVEPALQVDVNRERARCGAWYEMFPRSAGDGTRHGTFRDAEARLPEIARMGFDVLYLPPIHPIGSTHRKGPNNALEAGPDDPGSPWAIGAETGGHTAVHPDLGTLDDFDHFVGAAVEHGLEIALDLAFQCSPDHPWVRQHPEWFRRRPDGSIRYAENPPKKYQDIYPLDFDGPQWESLWHELREVVRFWIGHGVRIFRVDNPHTKPLRLWGWLISEVRAEHPDVIFLSEAFTRPKLMYALAKLGFDQSYTYFTWRNSKRELTEYLTELTASDIREFFRPNLFANTPDILPQYLQYGGRAAFLVRLTLAATLGASYGIYSGFELCEAEAVSSTEEYRDSEKYQIRRRDWNRPGNLRDYIRRLNRVRRENPALAHDHRLRFHVVDNEQLLFFSKSDERQENVVLVVVNLDPHHVHDGWLEVPIAELGIGEHETYQVHDLLGEGRFLWQGSRNYVRLDPQAAPAHVFRLRRKVRTEHDFDYFL